MYRLLLDENVEQEVGHRLDHYGHDVEHVDFVAELGKGASDAAIAAYSLTTDRLVVTYDDDFVLEFDADEYRAVLYVGDDALPPRDVADAVHAMSRAYPADEHAGVTYVGEDWL